MGTSKAKEAVDKDDVDMVCKMNSQSADARGSGGEIPRSCESAADSLKAAFLDTCVDEPCPQKLGIQTAPLEMDNAYILANIAKAGRVSEIRICRRKPLTSLPVAFHIGVLHLLLQTAKTSLIAIGLYCTPESRGRLSTLRIRTVMYVRMYRGLKLSWNWDTVP